MRQLQAQKVVRAASAQTHTTESSEEDDSSITAEPARPAKEPRRDYQSPTRPFKLGSHQVKDDSPSMTMHRSPPHEIIATSPGSQSQNLRRKNILQQLNESRKAKRPRLTQTDGPTSSPLRPNIGSNHDEPIELGSSSVSSGSDAAQDTPGSSDDEEADAHEDEIQQQLRYLKHQTYYDHKDNVQRCIQCEHELNSLMGHCEHCEEGAEEDTKAPYYEVLDPENGPRPEIAFNEYDDKLMDDEDRLKYVGDYLDDDSSAYDSQDEKSSFHEEYDEADSFIDTTSEKSEDSEESDNEEEPDWEQKFKDLQADHDTVVAKHKVLGQKHEIILVALQQTEEKYYDLCDDFGIPHSSDDDDEMGEELDEEIDEEGNILVNPLAPVPSVIELVVSHAEENSQNSELPEERIMDRVDAFEAVSGDSQGWQNIVLMSTGHNHSAAEIEL